MAMARHIVALLLLFLQGLACYQWSPAVPDGIVKYECVGNSAILPWRITLADSDTLVDIKWLFHDGNTTTLIAIFAYDNFIPRPPFSLRATFLPPAGLALNHVTLNNTGNYSVVVTGHNSAGQFFTTQRQAALIVTDSIMTGDGPLHMRHDPQAAWNNVTQEWSIRLTCGHLDYMGPPPFKAVWTTPLGETLNSTDYSNGEYSLLLPNPVTSGNYTCRLSPLTSQSCLAENSTREATLFVDGLEARITLIEGEQSYLCHENSRLSEENMQQERELDELRAQLAAQPNNTAVSFHARLSTDVHTNTSSIVPFDHVVLNQAQVVQLISAYDPTTGIFTVPTDGDYFFITSVGTSTTRQGHVYLMVDDAAVAFTFAHDENHQDTGTCQVVVHLHKGQRAWVQSEGEGVFWSPTTSFTGFRIGV